MSAKKDCDISIYVSIIAIVQRDCIAVHTFNRGQLTRQKKYKRDFSFTLESRQREVSKAVNRYRLETGICASCKMQGTDLGDCKYIFTPIG